MGFVARSARGLSIASTRRRGETRRAGRAAWGALACLLAIGQGANAQTPTRNAAPAHSATARGIRQEATRSLPLDKLDDKTRAQISQVVTQAGIFRRLPTQVIDCNPNLYLFLIRNPEVIVNIWELMGVSKVTMQRTSPTTFEASDHAGSRCSISLVYSDQNTHLVYAEGGYDGPLFNRTLRAKCVLVIQSASLREKDDRDYVTCRMDMFINIENVGVDLLAKTFQPLVTKSADYNFQETAAFVSMLSKTAERNPRGVARLAAKCKATDGDTRNQFAVLAQETADLAMQRRAEREAAGISSPLVRSAARQR